jgi:hypothetical protein
MYSKRNKLVLAAMLLMVGTSSVLFFESKWLHSRSAEIVKPDSVQVTSKSNYLSNVAWYHPEQQLLMKIDDVEIAKIQSYSNNCSKTAEPCICYPSAGIELDFDPKHLRHYVLSLNRSDSFASVDKRFASMSQAVIGENNFNKMRITVNVITYNRPKSLSRLLQALKVAEYHGHKVHIRFHIENGAPPETYDIIEAFEWSFGEKHVIARTEKAGLVKNIIESFYPAHEHDYSVFAEDDIEVSPLWFTWILKTLKTYRYDPSNFDPHMFGISLYTNRIGIHEHMKTMYTDKVFPHSPAYVLQIPCSWGALFFPEHWMYFRWYVQLRKKLGKAVRLLESGSNFWMDSWVKMYLEIMYMKGWYMLYPNFKDQTAFSTNHHEVGVHVAVADPEFKKKFVNNPLMQENVIPEIMPPTWKLPVLDYRHMIYNYTEELHEKGTNHWLYFLAKLYEAQHPK